jgi:hypothetical protein
MKRLGLFLAILAVLVAIPAMQVSAGAQCDNGKVELCHFDQSADGGHIIEVNENAVDAHLRNHGDCFAYEADIDCYGNCECPCDKN